MIKSFFSRQFIVFLVTGGFAALINFGSRFFFSEFMGFEKAVLLAYLVGMVTAYVLAKIYVFKGTKNSTSKSFFLFCVVNIVAIIQTYIISVGLAGYLFPLVGFFIYPEAVAHAVGVILPVFTSYIGHKYLSFRGAL